MKKALITGITGQDGSYLAELLLNKGYEVHGIIRRASSFNTARIDHINQDEHIKGITLHTYYGDLTDTSNVNRILQEVVPDEIYNLGAQSHVRVSFDLPEYTANIDALGTVRILDAIKNLKNKPKFYQASTSEMFGDTKISPQNENTPFQPRSPYGCAKLYAHWSTVNYREAYNIFACSGILFNHESPRRGETFVTRKITRGLARIKLGYNEKIYLGNLNAKRDWGYAPEYVEAMHLILQHNKPEDFVIATGISHTVREFAEQAAKYFDINITWQGKGLAETGIDQATNKIIYAIDPIYFRPTEIDDLRGDASKAKKLLNWQSKTSFKELIKLMAEADFKKESQLKKQ